MVRNKYGICKGFLIHLLRGSKPTIESSINKTSYFIEQAKEVHGDKYDYSLVEYVNARTNISIICKEHGEFKQTPNGHLQGQNCRKCYDKYYNSHTWRYSEWETKGLKSKYFDSFKVYIIKCYNKNESFYKIGKTYTTVGRRFKSTISLPYQWEIIKTYAGDARTICELENKLHKENKKFKYIPKIFFNGITECFSQIKRHKK